jgi:hypothetical protein
VSRCASASRPQIPNPWFDRRRAFLRRFCDFQGSVFIGSSRRRSKPAAGGLSRTDVFLVVGSRADPAPASANQDAARRTWQSTDGGWRTRSVRIVRGFPRRVEITRNLYRSYRLSDRSRCLSHLIRSARAHRDEFAMSVEVKIALAPVQSLEMIDRSWIRHQSGFWRDAKHQAERSRPPRFAPRWRPADCAAIDRRFA